MAKFVLYIFTLFIVAASNRTGHQLGGQNYSLDGDLGLSMRLARATYLSPVYNRMNLPIVNHSHPLIVYVGVGLKKILEVEEFKQLIKVSLWIREFWQDEYINWDPEEFDGMRTIRVEHTAVWTPDLVLYTNGGEDYEPLSHINVIVTHEGFVTYVYPALHSVACHMEIKYFPFDQHVCNIELGSWSYDSTSMDLRLKEDDPAESSKYDDNTGWDLINFTAFEKINQFGNEEGMVFKTNVYQITIRRHWPIHFFYMLIPILLIQILAVMQFLLPCDSGEKVILGITIYLSMLVYLLMVSEMLPSTEYIPSIVEYIVSTLVLVGTSEMITIAVLWIHHNGQHDNRRMLPHWARQFFLHWCARILCMQQYITTDTEHLCILNVPQHDSLTSLIPQDKSSSDIEAVTDVHDNLEEPRKLRKSSSPVVAEKTVTFQPVRGNTDAAAHNTSNNSLTSDAVHNDRSANVIPVHGECIATEYCDNCRTQCAPVGVKSLCLDNQERLERNTQEDDKACCCKDTIDRGNNGLNMNSSNTNDGNRLGVFKTVSGDSANSSRMNARQRRLEAARVRSNMGRSSSLTLDPNEKVDNKERLLAKIYGRLCLERNILAEKDIESEVKCEWQQLAMVLDRMMFIVYVLGTAVVIIRMYGTLPSYSEHVESLEHTL